MAALPRRFGKGGRRQADLRLVFLSFQVGLIILAASEKNGDEIKMRHESEYFAQDVGILLPWEMKGAGAVSIVS